MRGISPVILYPFRYVTATKCLLIAHALRLLLEGNLSVLTRIVARLVPVTSYQNGPLRSCINRKGHNYDTCPCSKHAGVTAFLMSSPSCGGFYCTLLSLRHAFPIHTTSTRLPFLNLSQSETRIYIHSSESQTAATPFSISLHRTRCSPTLLLCHINTLFTGYVCMPECTLTLFDATILRVEVNPQLTGFYILCYLSN